MTISEPELQWIGVDLDNTLAHNTGYPEFKLTTPLDGALPAMKEMNKKWKITIYTARHWGDYKDIEDWLNLHGIPFRRIICGKPLFKFIIDDKNIEFDGSWTKTMKKIS